MSRIVSIGLSPNIEFVDVHRALQLLFEPQNWQAGAAVVRLRARLAEILQIKPESIRPMISGRSALYTVLKNLDLKPQDEVVLQAFNCVAVVNAIQWAGARPIYADIADDSLNMSIPDLKRKITANTKAIVIQHTFGLPFVHWQELAELRDQQNLLIIEDCAHALGAEYANQKVGTLGDAAIFSFGRDKVVSSVHGGILVVNNPSVLEKVAQGDQCRENVAAQWIVQQLLHPILTFPSLLPAPINSIGKVLHYLAHRIGLIRNATSRMEKQTGARPNWIDQQYPNALAELALFQADRLDEMNQRRTAIAQQYSAQGIRCAQADSTEDCRRIWLRYPVLVDDPQRFHEIFQGNNIYLGDWYDHVINPAGVDLKRIGYQVGSAPTAERIAQQIINLPLYPRMTDQDVQRVIRLFHECCLKSA